MQNLFRFILLLLMATATVRGIQAAEMPTSQAEYKRSDMNFYWQTDVLKAYPSATILSEDNFNRKGDSYLYASYKKAPKAVYVKVVHDWIEPITPPDKPASMGIAPDAMQIREPHGDVEVALPSAPASFSPVTEGMALPNGSVVRTGANGTAAVLFGGVNSARLIPNSEAAVQQTVTPKSRSTEVDLTAGAVFSKVGKQEGVKEDYEVHTPFGVAAARGTDFVTAVMPARTDVWIAQGTVELDQPDGRKVGTVSSEGTGALKIIRYPLMPDSHQAMMADSETMTAAMNFIPLADQKIKALRDKMANGVSLTPTEQDYLKRIKEVPCLIKLALVEAAALVSPPVAPSEAPPAAAEASLSETHLPTPLKPMNAVVRLDGKVNFQGVTLNPMEFESRLQALMKTSPDQPIVIKAGKKVGYEKLKPVFDACTNASVKNVSTTLSTNSPTSPMSTETTAPNLPTPGLMMHPSMEPIAPSSNTNTPNSTAPASP
jgi:biopolymer transport protein ExbD